MYKYVLLRIPHASYVVDYWIFWLSTTLAGVCHWKCVVQYCCTYLHLLGVSFCADQMQSHLVLKMLAQKSGLLAPPGMVLMLATGMLGADAGELTSLAVLSNQCCLSGLATACE